LANDKATDSFDQNNMIYNLWAFFPENFSDGFHTNIGITEIWLYYIQVTQWLETNFCCEQACIRAFPDIFATLQKKLKGKV
jgi:hypothetical protein